MRRRARKFSDFANPPENLSFSTLSNGTSIKQNYVCGSRRRRHLIACFSQARRCALRVCHVHLAAKRFDVDFRFHYVTQTVSLRIARYRLAGRWLLNRRKLTVCFTIARTILSRGAISLTPWL